MNEKIRQLFKGKRIANLVVIGVIGLVLLVLSNSFLDNSPQGSSNNQEPLINLAPASQSTEPYQRQLETRLEEAFRNVAGVGEVIVMVTLSHGPQRIVAEDIITSEAVTIETDATGGTREITNRTQNLSHVVHGQSPLVLVETEPRVEGVIIVAQGGGDIRIVEALVNATRAVLGIEAHRVSVLEMQS